MGNDSITIKGKLEYKKHIYTYEVELEDINEKSTVRGFYYKIFNSKGKQRQSIWLYREKSLTDSIIGLIQMPKGFGES